MLFPSHCANTLRQNLFHARLTSLIAARNFINITTMSGSTIHKPGTDDGWHGVIAPDSQFPPEKGRYHLYIGMFAKRDSLLVPEPIRSSADAQSTQASSAPSHIAQTLYAT